MIAISARSRQDAEAEAREAGVALFLEEPIDPVDVVLEVLHQIFRAQPNGQAASRAPS